LISRVSEGFDRFDRLDPKEAKTLLDELAPMRQSTDPATSEFVQVFGRWNAEIIRALWQPASEKRQGRKSRSVVQRRCGVRYGDLAANPISPHPRGSSPYQAEPPMRAMRVLK
jgi:hypothetical protein